MSIGADFLRTQAAPQLIVLGAMVYEIVVGTSEDLWQVGFAHLEGSGGYQQAVAAYEQELRDSRAGLMDPRMSPADKAALERRLRERQAEQQQRVIRQWDHDPRARKAYLERCEAHICAMVRRAGKLRDELGELGCVQLRPDVDLAELLTDRRSEAEVAAGAEPYHLERWRFALLEEDEDLDGAVAWVRRLPEAHRIALGTACVQLAQRGARRAAEPFRPRPGSGAAPAHDGEGVRPAADRAAVDDPGGDRGEHRGADAGPRARAGEGGLGPAGDGGAPGSDGGGVT